MMSKWPEMGERIHQRLRAMGYWRADRPEVMRFALERQYPVTYLYKWLKGTTPDRPNLYRLAKDLGVTPAWLLFGDDASETANAKPRPRPRRPVSIAGGSTPLAPYPKETSTKTATSKTDYVNFARRLFDRYRVIGADGVYPIAA